MSIIPIPFSKESPYVKAVILRLREKNRFHIEDCEDVIKREDFWEEFLNLIEEERKNRQQ